MKTLKSYRFSDETIATIAELRTKVGIDTNSAVIKKAIELLKIVSDSEANGGKLILRESGGDREIVLLN